MKVAVPTVGEKGLRDKVCRVFAKAPTVTLLEVNGDSITSVTVERNPVALLNQGAGPIFAKRLKDQEVSLVLTGELGPGASAILEAMDIRYVKVEHGIKVSDALRKAFPGIRM